MCEGCFYAAFVLVLSIIGGVIFCSNMADQEASGENKPVPKQEGTIINLIVKDQQGSEVHFKVKTHTKLEKVSSLAQLFADFSATP